MNAADRVRIAWAVVRLQFWLEWYGAPTARCRAMRRELAGNLRETATEPAGVRAGVRRLGRVRELAREAAPDDGGFRWERGLVVASVALGVVALLQLLVAIVFTEGLLAAGGGSGEVLGTQVEAVETADSLTMTATFGWLPVALGLALLTFVVVSRPWRVLVRRFAAT